MEGKATAGRRRWGRGGGRHGGIWIHVREKC
jgi:hypothetical protein